MIENNMGEANTNLNLIGDMRKFINHTNKIENSKEDPRASSRMINERTFNHETKKSSINSDLKEFILSPDMNDNQKSDIFNSARNGYEDFSIRSNFKVYEDEFQKSDNSRSIEMEPGYLIKKSTANSTIPIPKRATTTKVTNSQKSSPSVRKNRYQKFNKYNKIKPKKIESTVKKKNVGSYKLLKIKKRAINEISQRHVPIITSDSIFQEKIQKKNVEGTIRNENKIFENHLKLLILKTIK